MISDYTAQQIVTIAQPSLSAPLNRYGEKTFGTPATITARVQYETLIDTDNKEIAKCSIYCLPTVTCVIGAQIAISGVGNFECVSVRDLYDIDGVSVFRKIIAHRQYNNVN
jgi:hypothetical protein